MINHEIEPVWDDKSEVLILGSFPSVKSREQGFFYGHPQNRFWRVLATIFECNVPTTIEQKKAMLLTHHVAVWDVIASCEITGSSDSSIKNVIPNDLCSILAGSQVKNIFVNGKTAAKLYHRFLEQETGIPAMVLPSTSPANAAWSLERLVKEWGEKIVIKTSKKQRLI